MATGAKINSPTAAAHIIIGLLQDGCHFSCDLQSTKDGVQAAIQFGEGDEKHCEAAFKRIELAHRSLPLSGILTDKVTAEGTRYADFTDLYNFACRITEGADKYLGPVVHLRKTVNSPNPGVALNKVHALALAHWLLQWASREETADEAV